MEMLAQYISDIGPYGFGLVATIVLWRVVVTPSLSALQTIAETLKEIQSTQKVMVSRLERLDERSDSWTDTPLKTSQSKGSTKPSSTTAVSA